MGLYSMRMERPQPSVHLFILCTTQNGYEGHSLLGFVESSVTTSTKAQEKWQFLKKGASQMLQNRSVGQKSNEIFPSQSWDKSRSFF